MRSLTLLTTIGLAAALALGETTVLPNYYETNHGSTHQNTIMRDSGNPRSYQ